MKRWEYKEVLLEILESPEDVLNKLGKEGWEVVCIVRYGYPHFYLLKRELPKLETEV